LAPTHLKDIGHVSVGEREPSQSNSQIVDCKQNDDEEMPKQKSSKKRPHSHELLPHPTTAHNDGPPKKIAKKDHQCEPPGEAKEVNPHHLPRFLPGVVSPNPKRRRNPRTINYGAIKARAETEDFSEFAEILARRKAIVDNQSSRIYQPLVFSQADERRCCCTIVDNDYKEGILLTK